jgi:hypothetical protein
MLETANILAGKATTAGASRFCMNSRKRNRAASSGMPNNSQRRMQSESDGSLHGFTDTRSAKPGCFAARHNAPLRTSELPVRLLMAKSAYFSEIGWMLENER